MLQITAFPQASGATAGTSVALRLGEVMDFHNQPDLAARPSDAIEFHAVLLVDDDRQLAQALQWILADANFLVDVANDGEEAIVKVRANEYDAVVCDVMMPKLRGDEFYVKARGL